MTEVRLRPLAESDLVDRVRYYRDVGGDDLGERFFGSAIDALDMVGRMPGAGSLRIGELCGVPDLRSGRVEEFPCAWFYFERSAHVDVVRLLAFAQDISAILVNVEDDR